MDQLANQISNVSLYDVKKYVRKAQNAVLNFSEMEAKVREATNNEPWGTPTSTMQQIADATNNYQQFHEIMPFIYRRFTEKSAAEWRQIYKSLQLLDYLVRNGSERVVDYARSHSSVVEMMRHFSYIDSRGVDQGASIRKRSEELAALLASTDKLRAERKKAKQLNSKTMGSGLGASGGFGGTGKKYGGISSDTYHSQIRYGGAPTQQLYGDGGGFDGSNSIMPGSSSALEEEEFEEYEVDGNSSPTRSPTRSASSANKATKTTTNSTNENEDDDFADFQAAPSQPAPQKSLNANILDLFDAPIPAQAPASFSGSSLTATSMASPSLTAGFDANGLNTSAPSTTTASSFGALGSSSNNAASSATTSAKTSKAAASDDLFGSLWESSKSSASAKPMQPTKSTSTPSSLTPTPGTAPAASQAPSSSAEPMDLLSF